MSITAVISSTENFVPVSCTPFEVKDILSEVMSVPTESLKKYTPKTSFKGYDLVSIRLIACQSLEDISRLLNINGLIRNNKSTVEFKNWNLDSIHNKHVKTCLLQSSTQNHYQEIVSLSEFFNSTIPVSEVSIATVRTLISQCKDSIDNLTKAHKLTEHYLPIVVDIDEVEKTHKYLRGLRSIKYHYQSVLLALYALFIPGEAERLYDDKAIGYFFKELNSNNTHTTTK